MKFAEIYDNLPNFPQIKGGGDKCRSHNYCEKYDKHLSHLQDTEFTMLEIGVKQGHSVTAWKNYFPKAKIVGIDINPDCKKLQDDKIQIEIGDQANRQFLKTVNQSHGPFNLIIDDGSHRWRDVIVSFKTLFPLLKNGGIYVVEDLHTSYNPNYQQDHPRSPIQYLKNAIDKINMHGNYTKTEKMGRFCAGKKQETVNHLNMANQDPDYNIYSLTFYPSICFIEKEKITNT